MKRFVLVVLAVMSLWNVDLMAQSACLGLKNPLNFMLYPAYSGQIGSKPSRASNCNAGTVGITFTGGVIANNQLAAQTSTQGNSYCGQTLQDNTRFRIMSNNEGPGTGANLGKDPCTSYGIPYCPQGYVKSIRVGQCRTGAEAEGLYYTMNVTPDNALVFINYAIVIQAILLAYDSNQVAPEDAPTDWPDLWENEAFWGKYESQIKLTGGTTRNVLAGILTRYVDPNGELGISDEGWAAIEAFFAHGTPVEDGVDLYAQIVNESSPVLMGQMWSSGADQYDAQYGTKTGYAIPECGIPYAVEGFAVVKTTKNAEEAKRFVEWFGSAQIQGEWSENFKTMPANEKAADKAPASQIAMCSIPAQDIDWALVAANIDAWCEKIMLEYMQ